MISKLRLKYKIAIATGSSRVTFSHSTDKDFQLLFDEVVTINDVKKGKPHPEQLLFAAKKLKVKQSECLVVGDSIYDCIAAKKAKMDAIGVLTGYTSKKELKKYGAINVLKSVLGINKII